MRISLMTFISLLFLFFGLNLHSQKVQDLSKNDIDSLIKRIEIIEQRQNLLIEKNKSAGQDIFIGVGLVGSGLLLGVAGGVLTGLARPQTNVNSTKQSFAPTPLQIVGMVMGIGGIGLSIGGLSQIGKSGKTMKDL